MTAWFHRFRSTEELRETLKEIGCDPGALPYIDDRRQITALRVADVDSRGANALKQEMLARGGDVAVHRHAIDRGVARCDCLIFGSRKQLGYLAEKLAVMPYWGLDDVRKEIEESLNRSKRRRHTLNLPRNRRLELGESTLLMAIVNLTDDSFFPGSRAASVQDCLDRVQTMVDDGADILDLGAESTRPGSSPATAEAELGCLVPAITAIRERFPDIPISIDTTKASVAQACVQAGADMVNDISGLGFDSKLPGTVADLGVPLILMHIKGVPRTMQAAPHYDCLPGEICRFFEERLDLAVAAGIPREQIVLDPGIGFGKTTEHNLILLSHGEFFRTLGLPILIGHSRKSTFGTVLNQPTPEERLEATLTATALCAWQGIDIVRVHDVRANRRTLDTISALRRPKAWR